MNGFQIGTKRLKVQHKKEKRPNPNMAQPPMPMMSSSLYHQSYPNTIPLSSYLPSSTLPGSIPTTIPGSIPGSLPGSIPGSLPGSIPTTIPTTYSTTSPSLLPSSMTPPLYMNGPYFYARPTMMDTDPSLLNSVPLMNPVSASPSSDATGTSMNVANTLPATNTTNGPLYESINNVSSMNN